MGIDANQAIKKAFDPVNNALKVTYLWKKYTKTFADFTDTDTLNTITLDTLPAGTFVHAVKMKHSAAFTGGAITAYTISVGITGSNTKYLAAKNVFQAPAEANKWCAMSPVADGSTWMEAHLATTTLNATATSTTGNLDAATAGSVDIWVLISKAV